MTTTSHKRPAPAPERLGILLQGMGAVASTVVAGVLAIRQGLGEPVGSLTQMSHIRLGKRTENRNPKINEFVPLANIEGIVFGGWDIFGGDLFEACTEAEVLEPTLLAKLESALREIKPMPGAFDPNYVKRLNGTHIKPGTRRDWANALRQDIRDFKAKNNLDRVVLVNCSSTEVYIEPGPVHQSLEAFERGLDENDSTISPAMVYAYSALMEGVPYANGTPSLAADIPALLALADQKSVPVAGKDFKTGQTMLKTVLSPMFKARMLGVRGWFSTNILGNRDGEVLEDPESFKSKEKTKLGVLDTILQPETYPTLYGTSSHNVNSTLTNVAGYFGYDVAGGASQSGAYALLLMNIAFAPFPGSFQLLGQTLELNIADPAIGLFGDLGYVLTLDPQGGVKGPKLNFPALPALKGQWLGAEAAIISSTLSQVNETTQATWFRFQ